MDKKLKQAGVLNAKIVGIRYYKGLLKEGEQVAFKRDPKNRHDKYAIEAHNPRGEMVGHLPRECVALLGPLMDDEKIVIEGMAGSGEEHWFIPVELHIYLTPKGEGILLPAESADAVQEVHNEVLKMFEEWENVSERRQLEIMADCEEFLKLGVCLETKLLIYFMGEREWDEDTYEILLKELGAAELDDEEQESDREDFEERIRNLSP
ncbi:hypothetical protein UR09_05665 [Candidatus Nitromaritima sp. SCGC AAA799-A02]|nr:hypothetical protein UZ36_07700 [Candidatus Nitromaritima sp. SCGC AAA799-C22]KMP10620.1 hypothetical protein UR09_05665 [Candidatus Nitromaritima sp. SCGC AAA799-A02]